MNIPVLIVACITFLAFVAHVLGGTKETAAIEPDRAQPTLTKHWVQAMCAFQMLSVDLLVVAGALFAIALKDFVLTHIHLHKQITRRPAIWPRFTLTG